MWLYIIVGISLCLLGIFEMTLILINRKYYNKLTKAKVISLDSKLQQDGNKYRDNLYPTYEYTVNGQTYRKQFTPELYNSKKYSIGQVDTIKFSSQKPEHFIVVNGINPYLYYSVCIMAGTVLIVLSCTGILPKLF